MAATTNLICPKCHGEMLTYERNGILVDQCPDCRGVFLDRGELDQLLDAERGYDGREEPRGRRSEEHHRHERDVGAQGSNAPRAQARAQLPGSR
jgi:Zn-finger nucleic acid-binding protein